MLELLKAESTPDHALVRMPSERSHVPDQSRERQGAVTSTGIQTASHDPRPAAAAWRARPALGAGLVLLLAVSALPGGEPTPSVHEDAWYVVRLQDQRCGYMHAVMNQVGNEVVTDTRIVMAVGRSDASVKISMEMNYRESIDGSPLGFTSRMSLGQYPVTYIGKISDGKLRLTTEQLGTKRESKHDFDPEVKFAWGQLLEQRKRGLKPGTSYTVKSYDPTVKVDGPISMKITVHDREAVEVLGRQRELVRVSAVLQMQVPLETQSWLDEEANPVVTEVNVGGMNMRMYRSTKEEALRDASPPELFFNTFIAVEKEIDPAAREVVLRLRIPPGEGGGIPDLPTTAMQQVKRVNGNEVLVTIRRLDWGRLRKASATDAPAEMKEFLRSSSTLDLEDKKIRRLAKKAAGSAQSPAEKADALRKFVSEYIEDKSLDIAFGTASEVARTRQGDCSEHGVLLAALARSAGLASRGVSGIVQIPRGPFAPARGGAFGYHMWTQVFIDGQWVDLDAALRETDCNPTHIALALMPLNQEGIAESIMSLLPLIGRVQIEVVEVIR